MWFVPRLWRVKREKRSDKNMKNMVIEVIDGVPYKVVKSTSYSDCEGCQYDGKLECIHVCGKHKEGYHYERLTDEERTELIESASKRNLKKEYTPQNGATYVVVRMYANGHAQSYDIRGTVEEMIETVKGYNRDKSDDFYLVHRTFNEAILYSPKSADEGKDGADGSH